MWKNRFDFDNATTFFVSCIHGECTRGEIWSELKTFGDLVDVFIPKKQVRPKEKYIFIRYENIKNIEKLLQVLNMVKLRGMKIKVQKAKYKRDGNPFEDAGSWNDKEKGGEIGKEETGKTQRQPEKNARENESKTYREILMGGNKRTSETGKIIDFSPRTTMAYKAWEGRTLKMEVKNLEYLCNITEILKNVTGYVSHIRYVGGLKVLVSFYKKAFCDDFFNHYQVKKSRWFMNIERWNGEEVKTNRIAWLKIDGVPIHAWDKDVFNKIGETVGKIVAPSKAGYNDCNLSFEVVGVLVESGKEINEEVEIIWNYNRYKIWITEIMKEWVPDYLQGGGNLKDNDERDKENRLPVAEKTPAKEDEEAWSESKKEEAEETFVDTSEEQKHDEVNDGAIPKENKEAHDKSGGKEFSREINGAENNKEKQIFFFHASQKIKEIGPKEEIGPGLKNGKGEGKRLGLEKNKKPKRTFDLNLKPDDPFDIDKIIWCDEGMTREKKRKKNKQISNSFLPEEHKIKKRKIEDQMQTSEMKLKLEETSKELNLQEETTETLKAGTDLGVEIENFEEEVKNLVRGELEMITST